jgi:SAM-dependent methyltransferase
MVCILNHENLYITDDIVEKYLKMLSVIDAPYFIRYLFKSKIIQSFNQFQKFVSYLNDSKTNKIDMSFGDSHIMRINYIKEQIDFKNNIIDIGCGEGRYIGALARQLNKNDKKYLACDIDEEILVKTKKKFDLKQMDNIEYYNSVHEVIFGLQDGEKYDCIITEVIEHMEMNEAKDLLQIILNEDKIKKIIVTTPNKDFNQFYFDDDDKNFRHEDHKFELTRNEFFNFIDLIIDKEKIDVEFYGIGDEVDGNQITSCAIIKRK